MVHQAASAGERDAVGPFSVGLAGRAELAVRNRGASAREAVPFPRVDARPPAGLERAHVLDALPGGVAAHRNQRVASRNPSEAGPVAIDHDVADADAASILSTRAVTSDAAAMRRVARLESVGKPAVYSCWPSCVNTTGLRRWNTAPGHSTAVPPGPERAPLIVVSSPEARQLALGRSGASGVQPIVATAAVRATAVHVRVRDGGPSASTTQS